MDENDRFEIINGLFYRDTGHLRPGKDDPFSNSSSPENVDRFKRWCRERLVERALISIHKHNKVIERVKSVTDCIGEDHDELKDAIYSIVDIIG